MNRFLFLTATIALGALAPALAQNPFGPPPPPRKQDRSSALIDPTGNWVSVVSEDWRWRMLTPLRGDAASIPIHTAPRVIVDAWDPTKDDTAGLQCKAYGAPGIMRLPGRFHITWQDDTTLKIETDYGTQTRLFHFSGKPSADVQPSWQGYSAANWEEGPGGLGGLGLGLGPRFGTVSQSLEVTTTRLLGGYLRKNGVPYSENTVLKEYYDRWSEPNGDEWLTVTTIVTDPTYLAQPFVTTTDFKKEPAGARWDPTPCNPR